MKKVEKVSIGRYAFTLEEDAFAVVSRYLAELESFYCDKEGGVEIMEGIEERMAELFLEKCGGAGIVSLDTVNKVLEVLGRPETIEGDADDEKKLKYDEKRKLFRDPSHKVLGGVCSGIAAYFNIDSLLVRLLFVIGFFGFASFSHIFLPFIGAWLVPVVYLVLWAVVPQAKTVQEKCQMRGEKGTFDEIAKNIESGAKEMGQRAKELGNSSFWRGFGRAICAIFGVILILVGIVGIMAGVFSFVGIEFALSTLIQEWLMDYAPSFSDNISLILPKILTMLIYFIPFLGILYSGLQMAFDFKSPKWNPGLILFIIWLLALIAMGVIVALSIFIW